MYCVLIRLVDKTQEETLIISILLIFTVTPVTMLIVFHRPLFDQFSANNFMISQKFVVLVFYKKCIHFSFYSEDVLNVLCLFIHDKLFFDISQAKTSWIGHKFEKLNNALTCSSSAVIAMIAVFLPANFIYSESDVFFKRCCLLVSVFSLSPTLLIVTRSVHTCMIINSIIIIDFFKPITCIL